MVVLALAAEVQLSPAAFSNGGEERAPDSLSALSTEIPGTLGTLRRVGRIPFPLTVCCFQMSPYFVSTFFQTEILIQTVHLAVSYSLQTCNFL